LPLRCGDGTLRVFINREYVVSVSIAVMFSLAVSLPQPQCRPGEGAIIAFFPAERFLYAGDYIQGGGPDSFAAIHAREVAAAVNRAAFTPERFAAMHLPLNGRSSLPHLTGQP
jgi:hypothetical protein